MMDLSREQRDALKVAFECLDSQNMIAAALLEAKADGVWLAMAAVRLPANQENTIERLKREAQQLRAGEGGERQKQ
jgi:hypothetical protein